jgi:hypothetical protein
MPDYGVFPKIMIMCETLHAMGIGLHDIQLLIDGVMCYLKVCV